MSFEKIGNRETLPEKVCKTIKESILTGELKGGDILPTEPELEKQFGVSRAVIRDAIRMLKAQGLIDVKHGKGMYVSHSQIEAFTDALLTTLRRDNASAWDVEQFEQILMPQILSVAATEATEEDLKIIKIKAKENMKSYINMMDAEKTKNQVLIDEASEKSKVAFNAFMISIFNSTHNKMISLIGEVLISMRKWRTISDADEDVDDLINIEQIMIDKFIKAIEQRDPVKAVAFFTEGIHYNQTIINIMKNTPVGTSPEIPGDVFFSAFKNLK
ncbi:MAG: GntR family transcriptional regulator [Spirochaetaceae bacterium]|jgi:GntR family transcriptional repressor for pyruvate dehydrogenase complex|nr:GntR family transcriptional regulator [Spirochaetaceae bacterium]